MIFANLPRETLVRFGLAAPAHQRRKPCDLRAFHHLGHARVGGGTMLPWRIVASWVVFTPISLIRWGHVRLLCRFSDIWSAHQ